MNEKINKISKNFLNVITIIVIAVFAYSITPKTFQNDTYYTIKIGEHIEKNTQKVSDLLPWNKGLDMQDPFSFHNIPYTYPHWLYDVATYNIYKIGGFQGIYYATCILAIILGILIYLVNIKLNKNKVISFLITIASLYCLKGFIAARAQLVTFILFVLTIFGIEQFLKTKKIRYALLLILVPIIIANVHSAVWPFYFVLYLPYIAEYLIFRIVTANYKVKLQKIIIFFKAILFKKKIDETQINEQKILIQKMEDEHNKKVQKSLNNVYKLKLSKQKNVKWLILIIIICIFTGLITPIKDTPYTYLIKTNQGNTTQNISEHLPLTLINNNEMIIILALVIGILIFTRVKIRAKDLFMLAGLIFLSFMSQRQVSMLVLIGNFIIARMLCEFFHNSNKYFKKLEEKVNYSYVQIVSVLVITIFTGTLSVKYYYEKVNTEYLDSSSYPVEAANYINRELIPKVGVENLKLYNEYNYGSYLLFKQIPVFIDSRADLYTPEFNGTKNKEGNYIGTDIFTDFLNISSLTSSYENKFDKYKITHVITYSNSKLNSLISKDNNYVLLYEDDHFNIYERQNAKIIEG